MFEAGDYVMVMTGDWMTPSWEEAQVDEKLSFGKYAIRYLGTDDVVTVDCARLKLMRPEAGQCLSPACSCEDYSHPQAGR